MSLNKKSIYEQSYSHDMLLRTNKETVTSIPNINLTELPPPTSVRLTRGISTYSTPQRTQVMNEMSQQAP